MSTFRPVIETSVSRLIHSTIENARTFELCAAIVGVPGVGKTMALRQYVANRRHAYMVTATPANASSLVSIGRAIATEMGVAAETSQDRLWLELLHKTRPMDCCLDPEETSNGRVLIIDEAQMLKLGIIRQILTFHDKNRMPVIFCGNETALKIMSSRSGAFDQIARRVSLRETIKGILDEDADCITNAYGVEGMDAYELMRVVGRVGQADDIAKVLQRARHMTGGKGTIRMHHICDALGFFPYLKDILTPRGMHKA